MQINNKQLARHFNAGAPYSRKPRSVWVETTSEGLIVYAKLYKTDIVKRAKGQMWIKTAGWNTQTTMKAINACLPTGWSVSRSTLHTPRGNTIDISHGNWVALEEPEWYEKYVKNVY